MSIKIYTSFNRPPQVVSPAGDVSMTDPQYARDCDINRIMRKADLTGIPQRGEGLYIDTTLVGNFAESLRQAATARSEFEELPAAIRARFGGDPVAFYEFLSDPNNRPEATRLGIVEPVAPSAPANPPSPPPPSSPTNTEPVAPGPASNT